MALIEIYISFRLRWYRCTTGKYKTNQFIVLIGAEMTSNKWYHRWIYQQAKREVNMPEHRPKREIRMPSTYYVQIKYIGSNALACAGTSESTLPLSDCGKFFMVSGTDENGEFYVVSFPVSPGIYVVAKKI